MTEKEIGHLEMKVLGLLKEEGKPLAVTAVQKGLKGKYRKELAYTTVMTVLTRLFEKNILQRIKEGRQYLYYPTKEGNNLGGKLLEKINQTLFKGNKLKPILNLIEADEELTENDLLELQKIIKQKIKDKKTF